MGKRIKYVCFYDWVDSPRNYNHCLASTNKLDYIFKKINELGVGIDIISMAGNNERSFKFHPSVKETRGINNLFLFPNFGHSKFGILRVFSRLFLKLNFIIFLLLTIKKDDEIVIYHSLGYARILNNLKKIIGFKIIGEIEEIYQDVKKYSKTLCKAENKFFENCDKYIFPTQLLNTKLNQSNKPYILIHGIYEPEPIIENKSDDGKIHVVYAGTFDPNKGGVYSAIEAAIYLPTNYHIHIIGFGNDNQIKEVEDKIREVKGMSKCTISYDGLQKGENYIRFLQKCHIGLSTQNPLASFNDTSFPSKILSYLTNGLNVVSVKIPVVEQSKVNDFITYYSNQNPEEIARAIQKVNINQDTNNSDLLMQLSESFKKDINHLINQ